MPTATSDVIVIGGGVAGLAAAASLAERGARVIVVEARPHLGGRASSFVDPATGETVDNGQHILMGCYRESFAFLRRIGAMSNVRVQPSLSVPMIDTAGRHSVLSCPPLPAPWHLLGGVMEWDALGWRDRLSVLRLGTPVRTEQRRLRGATGLMACSPEETVENWLVRNGQTARLREMLWDPLALAALNQPPGEAAAPAFVRVLAEMFGPRPAGRLHRLPGRSARRDVCGAGPATSSRREAGASSPTPSLASSRRETAPSGVRTRGGRDVRARRGRLGGSLVRASAVVRRGARPAAAGRGGRVAHGVLPDCHRESLARSARARHAVRGAARTRHAVGVRSRRHHGLGRCHICRSCRAAPRLSSG